MTHVIQMPFALTRQRLVHPNTQDAIFFFLMHLVMSETPTTVLVDYATAAIKTDSHLSNLGVINRRPTTNPEARFHIHTRELLHLSKLARVRSKGDSSRAFRKALVVL